MDTLPVRQSAGRLTRGWDRSMLALAALMAVTGTVSLIGLVLDDRLLGGQPIWAKPLKFSLSIGLYALAWAWLTSLTTRAPRLVRWSSRAIAVLVSLEMVMLITQVVRGRASHFNNATDLDNTLFQIMGVAIGAVWVLTFVLTVLVLRSDIADRATRAAVRLGAVISLAGIGVAFLMTGPTADQLRQLEADQRPSAIGAHAVGVPDGGDGLPLLGWSTTGGDLRIPHFVGMHALQVLPLLAIALVALAARWPVLHDERVRARLVRIAGAAYFGLTALVTWQALRGQSVVSPDGWTLAAFGALVGVTALASALAVRERVHA